ncbi:DUF427 domain-containing protein [Kineococcus aurantiacus]|uniref:Uncharacterized protein (DUF427 family) n=1 Tax=Kineococcus aurantiacus TaxID=37633 RepID=A0A7Y9DL76_9ACTN|nr:DUF427 domain-containing protein [Kineococcus aurantiacus]NYD22639.1 uncharacterized protein (DUF427 family) [Kineococcus aurantiacus]
MSEREHRVPGPDHPITITPTAGEVVVRVGGDVVARTTAALTLQESTYPAVQYVPLADVDERFLRPSATRTWCPYKGEASYWTLTAGGAEQADAVWGYPDASPAVASIAGHVAFYPDRVDLTVG